MKTKVIVGMGSCGIAAGANKTYNVLENIKVADSLDVDLSKTSCVGMCYKEPLVEIIDESGYYMYGGIDEKKAKEIIESHVVNKTPVKEYIVKSDKFETENDSYFNGQVKIALRNCGYMDPESIDEAEERHAYAAIKKIGTDKIEGDKVIQSVLDSGIRGRGGGGFPTGMKWKFAAREVSEDKYIICNADEGDPGAFMDRSLLEGDPHAILEGLLIGAYAIGANQGVIYCRAEYPLAIDRLNIAIDQAREKGYLGKNVCGIDGFDFDIYVKEGAGAFVCGEETALIASVEGERGMPRRRPPFPAVSGLWKKPTNINNVETLANIPYILLNGPESYNKYGTEKSKGTKVFALTGKIKNGGLVEVPMGITLRELIYEIGGGVPGGKKLKAVQTGGPSGGCIPEEYIDTPITYDTLKELGTIIGSGGMIVMDEDDCMVDVAKFFLEFTVEESCGQCTPCRDGTKRMLEILERITDGEGTEEDLEKLKELGEHIMKTSLCGLGQTAPQPVLSTMRYFWDEYEAHVKEKRCPAKKCKELTRIVIDKEKCVGCTACARVCPVDAISGSVRNPHEIDPEICTRCGSCLEVCRFGAISKVSP